MIRKTTAAALVLSAIPAALALTLFSGTAGADDTPWGRTVAGNASVGLVVTSDDTPWGRSITATDYDTPWGRGSTTTDDDTPWG